MLPGRTNDMPFTVTVDRQPQYLRYLVAGPASLKNYFDLIEQAGQQTRDEKVPLALVDLRGVVGRLHLSDQVFIGEQVVRKLGHLERLATVVPDSPDSYHSEKVARGQGFQLRSFSGDTEAMAWLCEDAPVLAPTVPPFVRDAGAAGRPVVLCLHSNAASSSQWRALMDLLAPRYRVLAVDSYGSGKSPDWPSDRVIRLADEVALLQPVLAALGPEPLYVVGHSYGAAIALRLALEQPQRVSALALYEPTLFSLIEAERRAPNDADGIRNAVARAGAALNAGDPDAAAREFIDYWISEGSWQATPESRKPAIVASIANVRRWSHALFTEPSRLDAFRALTMPILYLTGDRSTAAAHGVARRLLPVLPHVRHEEMRGLGHMGPITHADEVNAVIAAFLDALPS